MRRKSYVIVNSCGPILHEVLAFVCSIFPSNLSLWTLLTWDAWILKLAWILAHSRFSLHRCYLNSLIPQSWTRIRWWHFQVRKQTWREKQIRQFLSRNPRYNEYKNTNTKDHSYEMQILCHCQFMWFYLARSVGLTLVASVLPISPFERYLLETLESKNLAWNSNFSTHRLHLDALVPRSWTRIRWWHFQVCNQTCQEKRIQHHLPRKPRYNV